MFNSNIFGLVGLICLAIGWVPQTIKIIKEKQTIDLRFGILYITGSILLTVHAVILKDWVFTALNIIVASMSGLSLVFTIKNNKK